MPQIAVMDVQRIGQNLPDRCLPASAVDGRLFAGGKKQSVRCPAGRLVRTEERADVVPQAVGQIAKPGLLPERR